MKKLMKSMTPPLVLAGWHELKKVLQRDSCRVDMEQPRPCTFRAGRLAGRTLLCNPDVKEYQTSMLDGTFDAPLFAEVDKLNWTGKTIYDIGSHVGYHVMNFAERVGREGKVFSFEPHPLHCNRIAENLALNQDLQQRVTILNLALANLNGEGTFFYTNSIEQSSSSMSFLDGATTPLPKSRYQGFESAKVAVARLDDLVKAGRCAPPDMIKIDVEGAESMVLEGAMETLNKYRPRMLIEVHSYSNMIRITQAVTSLSFEIDLINDEWGRGFVSIYPK